MPVDNITATTDIHVHVDDEGVMQVFETPGGRSTPAEVEVTYRMPWDPAIRYAVYRELLGGFSQVNGLGVPTPGHAYPPSPTLSCEQIGRVTPLGIDKELLAEYAADPDTRRWRWAKYCLVPCVYRPIEYAYSLDAPGAYDPSVQLDPSEPILGCKQRIDANNTFIVVDNGQLEILSGRYLSDSNGPQAPRNVKPSSDGIPANSVAFILEYPRLPRNPYPFLRPYLGKVNSAAMWGLPPGHVLLGSASVDITASVFGPEISATLTFLGNLDVAWNETIDDDGAVKAKVFVNNNGSVFKYPFQPANHWLLLR